MKLVFPIIVSPLVSLKEIGQGITIYLHPQALTFLTSLSWGVQKQQKGVFEAAAAVMTKEKHPGSCSRQSRLTSRSLPRKAEGVGVFRAAALSSQGSLSACERGQRELVLPVATAQFLTDQLAASAPGHTKSQRAD